MGKSLIIGGYGISWGSLEPKEVEKVCCPLIDDFDTGKPNLPKSSCEARQKNREHKTCYGGCKANRADQIKKQSDAKKGNRRAKDQRRMTPEETDRVDKCLEMGFSVTEIADKCGRSYHTIRRRKNIWLEKRSVKTASGRKAK